MADNYLITGYWGEPHVTAENDRGINAAMFGTGRFVLPVGEQFKAEYIGNNTIRMYDGKLMDNGAAAGIPVGEYVDLLIANAGQGMKRNDLIVFQYEQDSSTLVESGKFVVIQGAESSGTASDPALTQEDLLSGEAVFDQMALWRVSVSGATISAPVKVFATHIAKGHNPHNLLDNSDFRNPVNQRGQTSYTGTSYKIDRWASYYSGSELTVNNGYISVTNNGIYQIVPTTATIYSAFACRTSGEIVTLTTQKNSNGTITVFLPVGDWVWAALYEGEYTEETIPDYHPKGFAHELLECQRYYVEIDHYALGTGYSGIGNDVTIFLQTPIQMRTVPTIICDGAIRARYGGTEYYTLDSCRIDAFNRGYSATMRLVGQAISGISTFQVVAGYATSKFALSADL